MNRILTQICAVLCVVLILAPADFRPAVAQTIPEDGTFVINLRDAEIRTLAEQVSEITGRTLVLDPNVSGIVTVISAEPLDSDGVWELFQSVLAVQGFTALPTGNLWRIVPQAAIREGGGVIETDDSLGRLDVVVVTAGRGAGAGSAPNRSKAYSAPPPITNSAPSDRAA